MIHPPICFLPWELVLVLIGRTPTEIPHLAPLDAEEQCLYSPAHLWGRAQTFHGGNSSSSSQSSPMAQTAAVILSTHNTISLLMFQCYNQRPDCFRRAGALCVFSDSICIPDNKVTWWIIRQNADGSTAEHQGCHETWLWWMITKFDWLFQADTLSNCLCVLLLSHVGCVSDHKLPKCQRQSPSGGWTKSNRPQPQTNTPDPSSSINSLSFLLCTLHSDSSI